LQHALAVGDLLLKAKAIVGHGNWGEWLRDHCEMSDRSAQAYMRLARNRGAIEAKSAGTADLSIEAALAALAKPTPTESKARPSPTTVADDEAGYADVPVRLGGQAIDIEKLSPAAQAQLAEKLLPATKDDNTSEEQWQRSLANMAGDAVSLRAFWNKMFGDWEKFEVPADLLKLTKQAALVWDQLATDSTEGDPDPLTIYDGDMIYATPRFSAKIKPIWDGSIKNDAVESASALAQFKLACAEFLPRMNVKDLETAADIAQVVWDLKIEVKEDEREAKRAADDAKRIKWEASHPEKAKTKAREQAQAEAMESDLEDLKSEAKNDGERWADVKDEKIAEWITNNWEGSEAEEQFEKDFVEKWAREHGVTPKPVEGSIPAFMDRAQDHTDKKKLH
jgi:hypothetical protein